MEKIKMRDLLMLIGILPIIRPKFIERIDRNFLIIQSKEDVIRNRKDTEKLFKLIKGVSNKKE